ncbi:MAG TPA: hypothetical protein DCS13_13215 [Candidatus Margulisbacteria bacterium]|nr:hypothetical protein [Candidatus Margulisiibacteriota bacterium]
MKHYLSIIFIIITLTSNSYAQHEGMHDTGDMPSMLGMSARQSMFGAYPADRDSSGTSWQPDSTPISGYHLMNNPWNLMIMGFCNGNYTNQGSKRGNQKLYSSSMFMLMGHKMSGSSTLGFKGMLSLDPTQGPGGYPLLLQTGETPDGRVPLIDRQHPHDLFMELALTYSLQLQSNNSIFVYLAPVGEPALGPTVYVDRFSGTYIPEAPISHHWLDSTHITFGVITLGYILDSLKLEVSSFRGKEPDENRWDIETPRLDSYSTRLSFNPSPQWAFQVSTGHLTKPEQLEPDTDINRTTFSVIHNYPIEQGNIQTTFAWGRNNKIPGSDTDAFLLESTTQLNQRHYIFGRVERVEKDELFLPEDPRSEEVYIVHKATLGYAYDVITWNNMKWQVGSSIGVSILPKKLIEVYGGQAPLSIAFYTGLRL